MRAKDVVLIGMLSALLVTVQVALRFLPNVELVSLLIIIYTLVLGWNTLWIIYIFAFVELSIYGFSDWWINYLYVWTLLFFFAMLFRENRSSYFWAVLSGLFGFCFGALCSIIYLFIGGVPMAFGKWTSGIPFDLIHGTANFLVALVLFRPLYLRILRLIRKWNEA